MTKFVENTLGEVCADSGGIIQTGPFGSQLHQSDYSGTGIPVVMPADIKNGRIGESRVARVSEGHVERLKRHKLEVGDIVYGRRGDIGRQAIIRPENEGWLCGTGCLRLSLGENPRIIPEYLHLYLSMPEVIGWIQNQAIGATMPNLNTQILKRVPLIFPEDLDAQKKIVAIFAAYDDLIENNKRRITLLENIAEEIYREWFVRFRFPGWQEAEFEKGKPAGWTHQKIAEAFDFTGGGTPSKDNDSFWRNSDVDWYTPSDITKSNSLFMASSEYQCNEEGLRRSSARLFPAYSVMMTSRATIGAIGINTKPACTNQGFITCVPNDRYPLTYLYRWLKAAKPHFEMLSGGATFPELIKSTFKRIEILSPDQGVIEKFDELVSPMFKQMESLAEQNRKLEQTKNQLLPRLISGKLSVENLDIQFPPSMQSGQSASTDEAAA